MARSPVIPAEVRSQDGTRGEPIRFMSVRQLAEYLQTNDKRVYALAAEGTLPGTKVTGRWLFPRELIDRWLLETSHGGVLTDRLLITGGEDLLLQRLSTHLAAALGTRALLSYAPTPVRLGLGLLEKGRADVCCLHWGAVAQSNERHPALLRALVGHPRWVLVRALRREQGIVVSPGAPAPAESAARCLSMSWRWLIRQEGSGAQRLLLDLLAGENIPLNALNITEIVNSEREAAARLAAGEADASPGSRAVAEEYRLRFVPAGWEALDFAVGRDAYFRTLFQKTIEALRGPLGQTLASQLSGYDLSEAGQIISGL
jgi:excisionase family DNA binding protein